MAKQGKKHSSLLSWFFKTIGTLAVLVVGAAIIYNIMPSSQKKLINNATGNQAHRINEQVPKDPPDFQSALKDLDNNKLVTVHNVDISNDGVVHGQIQGKTMNARLAGIQMLDDGSLFYRNNQDAIQDTLERVVDSNHAKYTMKSARDHQIYLFINGHMFQQTWLEKGLGYITVPSAYDEETSTLYTAQNNAQSNDQNIWQVNGAITTNGKNGYRLDTKAEKDYLDSHPVRFADKSYTTNFWQKLGHFFR